MKKRRRARGKILRILLLILLIAAPFYLYGQNHDLMLSHIVCESARLPQSFDGFRIIQVSDLHNAQFGENQRDLVVMTIEQEPDIVVLTGDLIDKRRTTSEDMETALHYVREIVAYTDVYFVTGNHEEMSDYYDELKEQLLECGVTVLEDQSVSLERDGQSIRLAGVRDIGTLGEEGEPGREERFHEKLKSLFSKEDDRYTILLNHRPNDLDYCAKLPVDLILSGHAHGGQIRLPFIGAVFAPDQGFFPRYTSGLYEKAGTQMVVSRGLGNSLFPFRVGNRPELVCVTLRSGTSEE
ncbi:metallophosphoesterase [Candidatus Soleaferrea massiliensis]|uniref:metallophosphoesterase n=1 Tax=Candidatus Soleaferrea massiliensis TaxID=1470354 RepID=UPI00058ADB40|nr:metallophosphoesterase [Candidatus Soleaferrea massiliensis]